MMISPPSGRRTAAIVAASSRHSDGVVMPHSDRASATTGAVSRIQSGPASYASGTATSGLPSAETAVRLAVLTVIRILLKVAVRLPGKHGIRLDLAMNFRSATQLRA